MQYFSCIFAFRLLLIFTVLTIQICVKYLPIKNWLNQSLPKFLKVIKDFDFSSINSVINRFSIVVGYEESSLPTCTHDIVFSLVHAGTWIYNTRETRTSWHILVLLKIFYTMELQKLNNNIISLSVCALSSEKDH